MLIIAAKARGEDKIPCWNPKKDLWHCCEVMMTIYLCKYSHNKTRRCFIQERNRTLLFIKQFQQTVHFLYNRWQPSFAMPCYLLTTKKSGLRWWPSWFVVQKVNTFNALMWCVYIMLYVTPAIKPCFNNNCNKSVWKILKSFCECNEMTLYLGRTVYCKWVVAASAPSPFVLL